MTTVRTGTARTGYVGWHALFYLACAREPSPPAATDEVAARPATAPAPPPSRAPDGPPSEVGPPLRFTAPANPATCHYALEEVRTETLGGQATGGHRITAGLRAEVTPATDRKGAALAVRLTVEHVTAEAKAGGYRLKLDSQRPADQRRVAGGADTLIFFDVIAYFALLGDPVTVFLAPTGVLEGPLTGARDARKRFLKLHPPKPRKDPRQRALVALSLSDRAILERLWPPAPEMPAGGIATGARPPARPTSRGYDDFAAVGHIAHRLSTAGDKSLLEVKAALVPPDRKPELKVAEGHAVPARNGSPERKLLGVERSVLVELAPPDPCILRAASQEKLRVAYRGEHEDQEVNAEQVIQTVRILTRSR